MTSVSLFWVSLSLLLFVCLFLGFFVGFFLVFFQLIYFLRLFIKLALTLKKKKKILLVSSNLEKKNQLIHLYYLPKQKIIISLFTVLPS